MTTKQTEYRVPHDAQRRIDQLRAKVERYRKLTIELCDEMDGVSCPASAAACINTLRSMNEALEGK